MKHWLLLGTALLLGGCSAYQAGGPKPAFRSLEIAPVRNATSRTGTHAVLHSKLTDAFAFNSFRVSFEVRATLTAQGGARTLFKDRVFRATTTLQNAGDPVAEELSVAPTLFADIASQIRQAATTAW